MTPLQEELGLSPLPITVHHQITASPRVSELSLYYSIGCVDL